MTLSFVLVSYNASAQWSGGVIGILQATPYIGGQSGFSVFPVVAYEGEKLVVRGPFADYFIYGGSRDLPSVAVTVSLAPNQLEVDGDPRLAGIEDRDNSFMTGFRLTYPLLGGNLNAAIQTELAGDHGGQRASVGWQRTLLRAGNRSWQIQGGIEVEYLSKDYANYYFGVSQIEAERSNFQSYNLSQVFQPSLTLGGFYSINKNWQVIANFGWQFLDKDIENSPLVEQSGVANGLIGVTYNF